LRGYDRRGRERQAAEVAALLQTIRKVRRETESPMVDQNLRQMEDLCLHTLLFFTDDVEVNPYIDSL
jgi:hypothetical protein